MTMKTKISDAEALERLERLDPTAPGVRVRDGAPIRRLSEAVDARDAAQTDVDRLVHEARDAGATWIEIGLALGISPQGARQRYTT